MISGAKAVVRRAGGRALRTARSGLLTPRERAIEAWKRAGNDLTLRLDYDLDERSVVLDVGGYVGQWASDVYGRFRCRIHVVEPVPEFAERCRRRFERNPDVVVHELGLAGRTREERIALLGVGSSTVVAGADGPSVRLVAAADFLAEHALERVDLAKLNVEGAEYELLEHVLDAGLAGRFRHLQVQFHDTVPAAEAWAERIRLRLAETHELEWRAPLVWESWRRRRP